MSKPKNRVMCPDCRKEKLLFDTEKKAQLFIDFNWEELIDDKEKLRIYYCPACCGYHISSHKYTGDNKKTDRLIEAYHKDQLRQQFDKSKNREHAFECVENLLKKWEESGLEPTKKNKNLFQLQNKGYHPYVWHLFRLKLLGKL